MIVALWIIAICEIIRIIQNTVQLLAIQFEKDMRQKAFDEYVASLHKMDEEFFRDLYEKAKENES